MDAVIVWTLWIAAGTLAATLIGITVTIIVARTTRPHAHLRAEWDNGSTAEYGKSYVELRLYNDGNAPARAIKIHLNTYDPPADATRPGMEFVKDLPYVEQGYISPNGEPWRYPVILGKWYFEESRSRPIVMCEPNFGGMPPGVTATITYQAFDSRIPRSRKVVKEKRITLVTESPSVMW